MNINQSKIQERWKQGFVLGYDCITYGTGEVVIADVCKVYDPNTEEHQVYWYPLCDTTLDKIEKYNEDIWTECDIFHGSFEYDNQKFVFGDGGMGNEGYIASVQLGGALNWSIFFTFSNPIFKTAVLEHKLICFGDTGTKITIDLSNLTEIKVEVPND